MKATLFVLLTALALTLESHYFLANATGSITGRIIDSTSVTPVGYATISLFKQESNKVVNGTIANKDGVFKITNVPDGTYKLNISFIGFQSKEIDNIVISKANSIVALGDIQLSVKRTMLNEVTVIGQKSVIENKIDKTVYNVARDISSQSGAVVDVLKKVPQVSVDATGNVELQGNSDIRFLIDGKPSVMFGSNIADVLQSIPASQIESIEVITSPGAKYDAQGTGGIINIILKHNNIQGINGNVSLTVGTIVQNGSVNINARKGKIGINAFVNGNARLTTTTPTNFHRVSTDSKTKTNEILQQDGSSEFNRHGFQSGIGLDWAVNDQNSISGSVSYHNFGNTSKGFVNQTEQAQDTNGGIFSNTNSINNQNSSFSQYGFDPSLNYKHTFKNKEQQLEISADGSFAHNRTLSGNDQYLQPLDSLIYGTRNNNPATENEYEIKADYVQPLHKDVNLGMGGKFGGYDIASAANAMIWNSSVDSYSNNATLSNNLNYHQRVYAAYAELDFPVGKSIEARLAGRYERTQVNAFYANSQQNVQNGYNTFIPSIFMLKKVGENQTFKLSYTIRINRPDYGDLNPYINASDPKNISTGNPNLKPEIWDRYEASYNNKLGKLGSFMITLFYRQSNGDIQSFSVYYPSIKVGDTTYNNVAVATRENIGVEKNAGTNLFFDLNLNEKFNVRSNIIFFYRYTINQVDPGYNSSTTIYRTNLNATYQFTNNFAAEFFGSFNSRHHEVQGYFPSFTTYSFALRKQLWNKRGSIALVANNFLSNYIDQRTDLHGPGFVTSSLRKVPYRSIGINFTFKFGKLEFKKEKEVQDINLNNSLDN